MDPVLQAVATALAGHATGAALAGGRSAWDALVRLVRTRFDQDPQAADALEAATTDPHDTDSVAALAQGLARAEREDSEFGRRLRSLWAQSGERAHAESGGVVNQISGTVGGHAVQAREIHGWQPPQL